MVEYILPSQAGIIVIENGVAVDAVTKQRVVTIHPSLYRKRDNKMATKTCPKCNDQLSSEKMICDCGYDFTQMDCPGCDARIADDSATCPHCKYNLVEDKPAGKKKRNSKEDDIAIPSTIVSEGRKGKGKKRAPEPEPEEEDDEPKLGEKKRVPSGLKLTHSFAPGQLGVADPNYTEMFWPKGQEVTDDTLLEWAEAFRRAYREKVPHRHNSYLSNHCVMEWCRQTSQWHAKRYNKEGQNDVLVANADRILKVLGGDDYKA